MRYFLSFFILVSSLFVSAQSVQDDFEGNGTITSWIGDDCGDDSDDNGEESGSEDDSDESQPRRLINVGGGNGPNRAPPGGNVPPGVRQCTTWSEAMRHLE